ncbi:tyrosine-type recombinase/integrase [Pseudomonas putida]|nr:tyrosine-type recombinase/integrase [Pseudomonas putida]
MANNTELDRRIRTAKPDPKRKVRIPCGEGLAAVINKGGTKKFVSRLRPLGSKDAVDFVHKPSYPDLTLKEAIKLHRALQDKVSAGIDPRQEQREIALSNWSQPTFGEIAERYFQYVVEKHKLRESTLRDYQNRYKKWIEPSIGQLKLKTIDSRACIRLLHFIREQAGNDCSNKGNGNRTASISRTVLSRVFSHAVFLGEVEVTENPTLGITDAMLDIKQQHNDKDRRFLTVDELCSAWQMLDHHRTEKYLLPVTTVAIQIALLTGMRRQEVVGMEWRELEILPDGAAIYHVPKSRMKGGISHNVYLSGFAMILINSLPKTSERIFQSARKGEKYEHKTITKNTLNNGILSILGKRKTPRPTNMILSIEQFAPHDLRRSFATGLRTHFKAPKAMIHAMIAHGSDDKDEIEFDKTLDMIYINADESEEQHKYWKAWSDLIELNLRSDER